MTARALMDSGQLDKASAMLEARLATEPKDVQARFLKGMIAVARQDNIQAVRIFRAILIDEPGATRVRLELARAFYLTKDYGNALRQFQLALAGRPPRQVVANINQYLTSIRDSKSLSYSFGLSVAPDTNLNTGSSSREVDLFGLPFDLSEEARQKSGIGLAVEGAVEWAPSIGTGKRLRIGLTGQRREYKGSDFDDMILSAYAGPRLITGKWDLSLLGTVNNRWYGAKSYSRAFGTRAEVNYYLTPRLGISGALGVQKVTYSKAKGRNGPLISLNAMAFYALTSSSGVTAKVGLSRQKARLAAYSNWSGFTAAGYFKELPLGFSIYVEPSISLARYDEALPTFGQRRTDVARSMLVTLLNRNLVLTRFTPRIAYTYTRQTSSVSLYDFTRNRVEIGLTTAF
ncbi:MAG: surface lipoprotein assembly modifier [Sphingomicrobium sp.]